jgi:hypothetical protein
MQGHNLYITVSKNKQGDLVEIFATVGENRKSNTYNTSGVEDSWAEGLAKIVSLALRAGVKPSSIIRNLKNIPSDKPVFETIGDCTVSELISSPPHAIARVMEEELQYIHNNEQKIKEEPYQAIKKQCDDCGSFNTIPKSPTCYTCSDCGYSKCN